jgi:hypothetical protein
MGIIRGLKDLNTTLDRPSSGGGGEKGRWLKLADNQSVKITFLQELDPDSPTYNKEYGAGFLAVEHTNPKDYRRKALCSMDDQGRCFGCEQHRKDMKAGWKGKSRLYINVLVEDGNEDPYVAIMSQGSGPKSATPSVIEYANETGSITNIQWRLKRSGQSTETSYIITPLITSNVSSEKHELFDLEKIAVRDIPYAEQEGFYLGSDGGGSSSGVSTDEEW